eukprot:364745-Chlamydomonas_euryale.AAC.6
MLWMGSESLCVRYACPGGSWSRGTHKGKRLSASECECMRARVQVQVRVCVCDGGLAPLEFKKPKQVGRMVVGRGGRWGRWSCARRGGRCQCCATRPNVRPGSRGVLLIQVQAWLMALFAMIVIWRQKIQKFLLHPEKPV